MKALRLGTRGSQLALAQSRNVARLVEVASNVPVELEVIRTTGDRRQDRPLSEIGGKGLFTQELDQALLEGTIDFAVHSLKDLPTRQAPGLVVACIPEREDPRDVLIGPGGGAVSLEGLPAGSVVGTSSLRRRALALAFRPDLRVESVRGNLDTRLRKVDEGVCDVLVLAAAGVRRLGLADRVGQWLERTSWLPAPGQGALGIVAREGNEEVARALDPLRHAPTDVAVRSERALLHALEGGCQVPIAALALPYRSGLRLRGLVASPDGRRVIRGDLTGSSAEPEALGMELAEVLRSRGADGILAELEERQAPGVSHP